MLQLTRRSLLLGAGAVPLLGNSADAGRKYLVLDSRIVDRAESLRLFLGQAVKDRRNPLFAEDKPWEPRFDNLYANVLWDEREKRFKCWYSPFTIDPAVRNTPREQWGSVPYAPRRREMGVCYAVSKDGLRWEKPELGLVEFDGSTRNNLVKRGPHGAGVFFDPRDPDPSRRYKMFFRGRHMAGMFSSDGLRWSGDVDFPAIEAAGDTHNNAFWAPELETYVGITRLFSPAPRQRLVARCESRDFVQWTKAVEVLRALPEEQPRRQVYALPVFRYANLYLGLAMMFDTKTDLVDCELAWSPDTVAWHRVCPGESLIPRGPKGSYDWGCVYAAAYPVIRKDEIFLYYGGSNGLHTSWRDGFFCLARLRPDGFAGYGTESAAATGTLVTRPFACTGGRLRVSADAQGGQLRVSVLDAEPFAMDRCSRVSRNVTDQEVRWTGVRDLRQLEGKQIRLRFELRAAKLYSFSLT